MQLVAAYDIDSSNAVHHCSLSLSVFCPIECCVWHRTADPMAIDCDCCPTKVVHRERYLAQQKLLQTARLSGLPLSPTANMASGGRTLISCGNWNDSSSGSLDGGGGTLVSCGSVAGRPQTVPVSPSRLGMRRSVDSLPLAADASTSGKFVMLLEQFDEGLP